MKKHLLKLLTGLTAVSLSVAQPVSVMACGTNDVVIASNEDNSDTDTSSDQLSGGSTDAGTGDLNNDTSNAGDDSSAADSTETTETQQDNKIAAESVNKETETTQQTEETDAGLPAGGTETDLPAEETETEQGENEQPEVTDGTQTENAAAGEQITDLEKETEKAEDTLASDAEQTEAAGKIADQSLANAGKAVVDGEGTAAKAVNTSAADAGSTQNSENKTSEPAKADEPAAGEQKDETAADQAEDEKDEDTDLEEEDAALASMPMAVSVLNEDEYQAYSASLTNVLMASVENKTEATATVTKKDGTVSSYNTLQEAIAAVNEEETTISLLKDVTENVVIKGVKNFVLDLCGKTITSAKDAAKACIEIVSSTVTIKNTGAEKDENGNLTKASVTGSTATGIKISRSSVDLIGLLVKDNQGVLGGGINVNNSSTLTVKNCVIEGNTALAVSAQNSGVGGGILAENSKLNVENTIFANNEATGNSYEFVDGSGTRKNASENGGGAISVNGCETDIKSSYFNNNKATGSSADGGAIAACYGSLNISDSEFTSNTAVDSGGALNARGVSGLTISDSTFGGADSKGEAAGNNCGQQGGAINIGTCQGYDVKKATLSNVNVLNNTANNLGGGIYVSGADNVEIIGSIISGNKVLTGEGQGGGICDYGAKSLTLSDTKIINNQSLYGGGIFRYAVFDNQNLNLVENTMVEGNVANYGGGLYICSLNNKNGTLDVVKSTINGNTAKGYGGGIYSTNSTVTIENGSEINNNSAQNGAGIYSGNDKALTLKGSTVEANRANGNLGGGGIFVYNGYSTEANKTSVKIQNTDIQKNVSAALGGGLTLGGYVDADIDADSSIMNNVAALGGGIGMGWNNSKLHVASGAKLYNNTASTAGDDLYATGGAQIWLPAVGTGWKLEDCGHTITGWYIDETGARWDFDTMKKNVTKFAFASGVKAGDKIDTADYTVVYELGEDGQLYAHITVKKGGTFALKAAHGATETPNDPSTPAGTVVTGTATATATPAVLGATRTPEVVETAIEEPAVLGAEREPAVLGATRGHGTGDESNMGVWGALSLTSLASLAGIGAFFARKKKED